MNVDSVVIVAIVIISVVIGLIMRRSDANQKQRNLSSATKNPTQPGKIAAVSNVEDPLQKIRDKISGTLDMEQFRASNGKIDAPKLLHYIGSLTPEEQNAQLGVRQIQVADAELGAVNLSGGRFASLDFPRASFQEAVLENCAFVFSGFEGADFTEAKLALSSFYKTRLIGTKFCSINGFRLQLSESDLRTADLSNAFLMELVLTNCQLENAIFIEAHLNDAFIAGECKGANFQGAQLQRADLSNATLIDCQFEGARYNHQTKWPIDFDPVQTGCISNQEAKLREQQEGKIREQEIQEWSQKAENLRQQGHAIPQLKEIGDHILEIVKLIIDDPSNRISGGEGNFTQAYLARSGLEQSYWMSAEFVLDDMILEQAMGGWGPSWKETLVTQIYSMQQQEVNAVLASQGQLTINTASNDEMHPDAVSLIERLARLRDQGILSEEEFQKKKAELLNRI